MKSERHHAVERFLKVADAAAMAISGKRYCEYSRIDIHDFLALAYSDRFSVAEIDEGTACIAANEWDQSNFVMGTEN